MESSTFKMIITGFPVNILKDDITFIYGYGVVTISYHNIVYIGLIDENYNVVIACNPAIKEIKVLPNSNFIITETSIVESKELYETYHHQIDSFGDISRILLTNGKTKIINDHVVKVTARNMSCLYDVNKKKFITPEFFRLGEFKMTESGFLAEAEFRIYYIDDNLAYVTLACYIDEEGNIQSNIISDISDELFPFDYRTDSFEDVVDNILKLMNYKSNPKKIKSAV